MRILLLGFLLASSLFLKAQNSKPPIHFKTAISFNPLALLNIDHVILAGIEYKIEPGISLIGEVGYIFASNHFSQDFGGENKVSGFMFRPAVKFYVNERNNFYLQPQVFFKQVNYQHYGWVGKDCVDGVPSYNELEDYKFRRQVYGFNAIMGFLTPVSKKQQIFLDFYFGFGVRNKNEKLIGPPNSCIEEPGELNFMLDTDGVLPSLPIGLKLLFTL